MCNRFEGFLWSTFILIGLFFGDAADLNAAGGGGILLHYCFVAIDFGVVFTLTWPFGVTFGGLTKPVAKNGLGFGT